MTFTTRRALILYGVCHAGVMLAMTILASSQQPILSAGYLFNEPWFNATMVDTYLGFLLFILWVWFLEASLIKRVMWTLAVLGLGNMAMGAYISIRAYGMASDGTLRTFLAGGDHD